MNVELEFSLRLIGAAILGGGIGLQRELVGKPAGMRTHILICVGCALFAIISAEGFDGSVYDPSRIAAGVVTGIGFLGAGAIIRGQEGMVSGLTTAASIWAVAAVGLGVGVGLYIISVVAAVIFGIALALPKFKE